MRRGDGFIADRYCGEDYRLRGQLAEAGVAFVVRLRDEVVITVEEERPPRETDRAAAVQRSARVRRGGQARCRSARLRVVWVRTPQAVPPLVTNLGPASCARAAARAELCTEGARPRGPGDPSGGRSRAARKRIVRSSPSATTMPKTIDQRPVPESVDRLEALSH